MLDKLDDIEWSQLGTAYENAADVPMVLRKLLSEAPDEWVTAIDFLYGHLCHQQCTVYEATPVAIPFLLEIMLAPQTRCRGRILELLADMARANSYLAAHGDMSFYDKERETAEFQTQLAKELKWVQATRAEVWRGLDCYIELLADDNRTLRLSVPYTLGLLTQHASQDIPEDVAATNPFARISQAMSARLDWEAEPLVRASLLYGLMCLQQHYPDNLTIIEQALNDAAFPVRLAAALCLANTSQSLPEAAINVLCDALRDPHATDSAFDSDRPGMESSHHPLSKAYAELGIGEIAGEFDDVGAEEDYEFPWREHRTQFDVVAALCRLPPEYLPRLFPLFRNRLQQANCMVMDYLVAPILIYVFSGKQITAETQPADLTDEQRTALQDVYDNPKLWATMMHTASAYRPIGLDTDRREWRRVMGIEHSDPTPQQAEKILDLLARESLWQYDLIDEEPLTAEQCLAVERFVLRGIGSDVYLPLLARYPLLKDLDLCQSDVTAAGIQTLPHISNLQRFHLTNTPLDSAALSHIAELTTLTDVNLSATGVTDEMLPLLLPLQNVQELSLYGNPLTDAAIETLLQFSECKRFILGKTDVTEAGRARLQQAFPEAKVWC